MKQNNINRGFWIKLGLVPIGMFAFAFALVPLYNVFCNVTGLNGRGSNEQYIPSSKTDLDMNRRVTVSFLAAQSPGFPVKLYPKTKMMDVIPGKMYTIKYVAENHTANEVTGQAVHSVAPGEAAQYFKKVECFCFTRQMFKPGQVKEMPVSFIIQPALDKSVRDVTLSYNFFRIPDEKQNQGSQQLQQPGVLKGALKKMLNSSDSVQNKKKG